MHLWFDGTSTLRDENHELPEPAFSDVVQQMSSVHTVERTAVLLTYGRKTTLDRCYDRCKKAEKDLKMGIPLSLVR